MCGKWKVKDQKQIDIIHHDLHIQNNEVAIRDYQEIRNSDFYLYMYIQKYVKLRRTCNFFMKIYLLYCK